MLAKPAVLIPTPTPASGNFKTSQTFFPGPADLIRLVSVIKTHTLCAVRYHGASELGCVARQASARLFICLALEHLTVWTPTMYASLCPMWPVYKYKHRPTSLTEMCCERKPPERGMSNEEVNSEKHAESRDGKRKKSKADRELAWHEAGLTTTTYVVRRPPGCEVRWLIPRLRALWLFKIHWGYKFGHF